MHQREFKKSSGAFGTIYEWQGHKARVETRHGTTIIKEITPPNRVELIKANPGWGAHGKAQSIMKNWWDNQVSRSRNSNASEK